jgi:hypothetical protein
MAFINRTPETRPTLEETTIRLERNVHAVALGVQFGSSIFAGGAAWTYMTAGDSHLLVSVGTAALVGGMTFGALLSFTNASVKLLPRLLGTNRLIGGAAVVAGLAFFACASGTATATLLGHGEAKAIQQQQYLVGAEEAFREAQQLVAELGQMSPLLASAQSVSGTMRSYEETRGENGTGQGPIYAAILSQETRIETVKRELDRFVINAASDIRSGEAAMDRIREAIKNPELTEAERERNLENGLTRLGTITIALREEMPLTSLRGISEQLMTPPPLAFSSDPARRRVQEDAIARIQGELEPVATAMADAVAELEERSPARVPIAERKSPTALVFEHAEQLWFILMMAYSLDVLPFLAVGLILLAHSQLDQREREQEAILPTAQKEPRPYRRRLPNGHDTDGDNTGTRQ